MMGPVGPLLVQSGVGPHLVMQQQPGGGQGTMLPYQVVPGPNQGMLSVVCGGQGNNLVMVPQGGQVSRMMGQQGGQVSSMMGQQGGARMPMYQAAQVAPGGWGSIPGMMGQGAFQFQGQGGQ